MSKRPESVVFRDNNMPAMSASVKVRGRKRVWMFGGPLPSLLICFLVLTGDTSVMKAISVVMILKEMIDGLGALLEDFRLDGRQLSYERSALIYEIL